MRSLSAEVQTALESRSLVARDFLWIVARNRETGTPVADGYWSDLGVFTCQVISPETGNAVTRTFFGSGMLIQISDIPAVSNLTVQNATIRMSQVAERINQLVRQYDCQQAKVEIFRGLFDPITRQMVAPAPPRFAGFIDQAPINTGPENSEGAVEFTCVSHTQELMRHNPDTRSDASQRLRGATDNFYQDTTVVGEWEQFWGRSGGKLPSKKDLILQGASNLFGGSK